MNTFLFFIPFILASLTLHSQVKAITEKGDTILVFKNGTWTKYQKKSELSNQDSKVEVTITVDEFSDEKKICTKNTYFSNNDKNYSKSSLYGSICIEKDLIIFEMMCLKTDLGCMIQNKSMMQVKLTNGEIIDFIQISPTSCKDSHTISFYALSKDNLLEPIFMKPDIDYNLSLLKTYNWEVIRITGSEYYINFTATFDNGLFFKQHLLALENNK